MDGYWSLDSADGRSFGRTDRAYVLIAEIHDHRVALIRRVRCCGVFTDRDAACNELWKYERGEYDLGTPPAYVYATYRVEEVPFEPAAQAGADGTCSDVAHALIAEVHNYRTCGIWRAMCLIVFGDGEAAGEELARFQRGGHFEDIPPAYASATYRIEEVPICG